MCVFYNWFIKSVKNRAGQTFLWYNLRSLDETQVMIFRESMRISNYFVPR